MRRVFITTAFILVFGPVLPALSQDFPIVYSRCPRTVGEISISGDVVVDGHSKTQARVLRHPDIYDQLPDVTHFFSDFTAPCDLVYRDADGTERVLYQCIDNDVSAAKSACAALDPAVSFDARTVAFTVFRGTLESPRIHSTPRLLDAAAENRDAFSVGLPNRYLHAREAQLYLVDIGSGKLTALPHEAGVWDSGPAWLSDGRLAFTSTRGDVIQTQVPGGRSDRRSSQIFTMSPDGRNVEQASFHALAGEQHPLQLMDGRVAYSSWQLFGSLAKRGNALHNLFHIYAQYPDGAHPFALYGQHTMRYPGGPAHNAAHFIGQSSDGRLWTTDYYRANNSGMGTIYGFVLPQPDQEGIGPDEHPDIANIYRPRHFVDLAPWTSNGDRFSKPLNGAKIYAQGYTDPLAFAGKLRDPVGIPANQLMLTWGKGACSTVAHNPIFERPRPPLTSGNGGLVPMNALTLLGLDNPGCDAGIYMTTLIPSVYPDDLKLIVDRPEYHEFMGRPVLPYKAIYGIDRPAQIARSDAAAAGHPDLPYGTPFGLLGAASILYRETRSIDGHPFASKVQWALQGTDAVDYRDDELCGVRILAVQPNRQGDTQHLFTAAGERVAILGEFPVRKQSAAGKMIKDSMDMPDTSFMVRFPANTPYLMQGIDCEGRTLNTDQTWQHLRPGEVKTCGGCHVHGKRGLDFSATTAAQMDYQPYRLGEGRIPLLNGGSDAAVDVVEKPGFALVYEFERDIMPIFERRCANCHSGEQAVAGLRLDLPGTHEGSTWQRLADDRNQRYVPKALRYPSSKEAKSLQLSKYLRFMNSRGSLLYWKAANQRLDGRSDDQFDNNSPKGWNDIDFGNDHRTTITATELAILSRWIDTGAGAGEQYLSDTTPLTLNLVGMVSGSSLLGLRIGTADVPSGIDEASLKVCIHQADGHCGPNLATRAQRQGIVEIKLLAPLRDPDLEVIAQVKDKHGNSTRVARTVGWLIEQALAYATVAASNKHEDIASLPDERTH